MDLEFFFLNKLKNNFTEKKKKDKTNIVITSLLSLFKIYIYILFIFLYRLEKAFKKIIFLELLC